MTADTTSQPKAVDDAPTLRLALFDLGAHLRLWIVAAIALTFDLWSKAKAFDVLGPLDEVDAIPGVLFFRRSVNPGALFGMGKGMVPLFIAASLVALAFVFYLFASSAANRRSLHVALAFVLAGSLGNLYDRVFIKADRIVPQDQPAFIGKVLDEPSPGDTIRVGAAPDGASPDGASYAVFHRDDVEITQIGVVRDFLKFAEVGGIDVWPWVFNVADSLLVAGVGLLMINFWFERREARRQESAAGQV